MAERRPDPLMRLLFLKTALHWPRTTGHDVHCFEMMRALAQLGHEVRLVTEAPPAAPALDGLTLAAVHHVDDLPPGPGGVRLSYFQDRFRQYWGIEAQRLRAVQALVTRAGPDVVVAVGAETLPYLAAARGAVRVWYAADEWVRHHLSHLSTSPTESWFHVRAAVIKGLYERSYASAVDRVWVVSDAERRAMRCVTGLAAVDVVPNGVDCEAFAPTNAAVTPHSAVFWGRLSFAPNLQAIRWFTAKVWPRIRAAIPDATFTILGSDPPGEVRALAGRDGVALAADLPDLRASIARQAVVVMPFVSGGGIKNKLLEAAALAKPIVATPKALFGLRTPAPALVAATPEAFAAAVTALWREPDRGRQLGASARAWVSQTHTWQAAAAAALAGIDESVAVRSAGSVA